MRLLLLHILVTGYCSYLAHAGTVIHPQQISKHVLQFHICDIPNICDEDEECVKLGEDARCDKVSYCQEDSCPSNSNCEDDFANKAFKCVCKGGLTEYEGACVPYCEVPQICQDGMQCVPYNDAFRCECPDQHSYYGGECAPMCQTHLCPEDMVCLSELNNTFSCICPEGQSMSDDGECEKFCRDGSCPEDMECQDNEASFSCVCSAGKRLTDAGKCVAECELAPCPEGQSCVSFQGKHSCCATGQLPDGETSQCTPVCQLDVCEEGLDCVVHNINGSFSCVCPDYHAYDNGTCVEFCQLELCDEGMQCQETYNGFNCTCNGESCSTCLDNPCAPDFVCVQQENLYTCVCDTGYSLKHGSCVDIDECAEEPCAPNSECTNIVGSYLCACERGTYYNDTSRSCDNIDECLGDPCGTLQTGMLCGDLERGFTCSCPPEFPAELCAEGSQPCDCGEREKCVLSVQGDYHCDCDDESIRFINNNRCIPNYDLPEAAVISVRKPEYQFTLGKIGKIEIKINDADTYDKVHWNRVTWVKQPGQVITKGDTVTPRGHFATPYFRKMVRLEAVRPEDRGNYTVIVQQKGHRTVQTTVHVNVKPPLRPIYGPKDISNEMWEFRVGLSGGNLDKVQISWYREVAGHLERLQNTPAPTGLFLRVGRIPGLYIARLSCTMKGSVIHSEVGFDATLNNDVSEE